MTWKAGLQACPFQAGPMGEYVIISLTLTRSISIVIPAYNEEKRLPATLVKIHKYLAGAHWDFSELIVVDDGSRDATAKVAREAGARVLENPGNRGKGYQDRKSTRLNSSH